MPVTAYFCVRKCREEPTTKARTATTRCSTRRKTPTPPGGTCPKVRTVRLNLWRGPHRFLLVVHCMQALAPVPPSIVAWSLTHPVPRLLHACRLAPPALVARVPGRCRMVKRGGEKQCHSCFFHRIGRRVCLECCIMLVVRAVSRQKQSLVDASIDFVFRRVFVKSHHI